MAEEYFIRTTDAENERKVEICSISNCLFQRIEIHSNEKGIYKYAGSAACMPDYPFQERKELLLKLEGFEEMDAMTWDEYLSQVNQYKETLRGLNKL